MTAQQLSDELRNQLGFEMKRTVIGNLESGYRRTITLAEVLALADVLSVPPVLLVVPLGKQSEFEVLPDTKVDPWRAARWLTGEGLPPDSTPNLALDRLWQESWQMLDLYRKHEDAVFGAGKARRDYQQALDELVRAEDEGDDDDRAEAKHRVSAAEAQTRQADGWLELARRAMGDLDLLPPPLKGPLARRLENNAKEEGR